MFIAHPLGHLSFLCFFLFQIRYIRVVQVSPVLQKKKKRGGQQVKSKKAKRQHKHYKIISFQSIRIQLNSIAWWNFEDSKRDASISPIPTAILYPSQVGFHFQYIFNDLAKGVNLWQFKVITDYQLCHSNFHKLESYTVWKQLSFHWIISWIKRVTCYIWRMVWWKNTQTKSLKCCFTWRRFTQYAPIRWKQRFGHVC